MPVKVMLPVTAADPPPEKVKFGPKVLMSGFMTKRTRSLKRWKQRWWQLMDNGILHYFKSDDHPQKLLGKIDVGKTCYAVKLGAEVCHVKFPRAVPSCCCFCFAVLNRTYYVYTPTPDEAQKWAQAINDLSRVINRKVVAGLERRKAPLIPCMHGSVSGNMQVRVTRVRIQGNLGGFSDSCLNISQVHYLPIENNKFASRKSMATSVPSRLDKICHQGRSESHVPSLESFLEKSTSASSEMLQGQQSEIDTMEQLQVSTNGGHRSSLPLSLREDPPLGSIQQASQQQQKHQKHQEPQQQQNLHINNVCRHRSHSLEDICSSGNQHQPLFPTQSKPVAKPRKGKAAYSLDQEKSPPERHAQKAAGTEVTEVRPPPPLSSPPPSHLPPPTLTTTCQHAMPRLRKNTNPFPFSPPSSPPPPPPQQNDHIYGNVLPAQQNDHIYGNVLPSLPLSSPPSSRTPKKNTRALSHSTVTPRPAKPFVPPRPITETVTAPFSSPPRPRKKTMTHTSSKCQISGMDEDTYVIISKPKPKHRFKRNDLPKCIVPLPTPLSHIV